MNTSIPGSEASLLPLLKVATLIFAALASCVLVWYLVRRPRLDTGTRLWLLVGVGILPLGAALTGNIAGFEVTTQRTFCRSCHTMESRAADAADPNSQTLAAKHSRNEAFGGESCYTCHSDYGMFGTITTKLNGLRHVWVYTTKYQLGGGKNVEPIHTYKPFPNSNCLHCHSGTLPRWREETEHSVVLDDILAGKISCVSQGCHGPPHPGDKPPPPAAAVPAPAKGGV